MTGGHLDLETFKAFFSESLSEERLAAVATHLQGCEQCRRRAISISDGLLWAESMVDQTRLQSALQARLAEALLREETRTSGAAGKDRLRAWRHHLTSRSAKSGRVLSTPRYALHQQTTVGIRVRTRGASPAAVLPVNWLIASGTPPKIHVPDKTAVTVELAALAGKGSMMALIPVGEGEILFADATEIKQASGSRWIARFNEVPVGEYLVAAEPQSGERER